MNILLINDDSIMIQEADFPDYFIDKHHPDDFKPKNININPEFIFHKLSDHNRIILRISIKTGPRTYIPLSFVCDTGAPSYIYVNKITRRLIKDRITDDGAGNEIIIISNKRMGLKTSPALHEDTNIIGLLGLSFFKLYFEENGVGFNFYNLPEYF